MCSTASEAAAIVCACLPLIAAQAKHILERFGVYWNEHISGKKRSVTNRKLYAPKIHNQHRPIRLMSRRGSARVHDQGSSEEQLHTGTQTTVIGASQPDRSSGFEFEDVGQIRVKTDMEWGTSR